MHDLITVTTLLRKLYGGHHTTQELIAENKVFLLDPTQAFFLAIDGDAAVGVAHVSVRREYVEGSNNDVCGYLEAVYIKMNVNDKVSEELLKKYFMDDFFFKQE